jgi:hypothetical protein
MLCLQAESHTTIEALMLGLLPLGVSLTRRVFPQQRRKLQSVTRVLDEVEAAASRAQLHPNAVMVAGSLALVVPPDSHPRLHLFGLAMMEEQIFLLKRSETDAQAVTSECDSVDEGDNLGPDHLQAGPSAQIFAGTALACR